LPTPPEPARVTSRLAVTSRTTSARSRSRPINAVNGTGKPGGQEWPPRPCNPATTAPPTSGWRRH
jgi:hypothetical protein